MYVHSAKTNHLRLFAEKSLRLPIIWEEFEMGDVLRIGWGASMLVITETHRLSSTGGLGLDCLRNRSFFFECQEQTFFTRDVQLAQLGA